MADFGSSDSGASLGDILGAALNKAREEGGGDVDGSPSGEVSGPEEVLPEGVSDEAAAGGPSSPETAEGAEEDKEQS